MNELEKYNLVNSTKTLEELANVIRLISPNGFIQGRLKVFESEKMAKNCENFSLAFPNVLTRHYGIRQQAIMIKYYSELQ